MNSLMIASDTIYRASDITAGVFIIVLIFSITLQTTRRTPLTHLYASAVLILAGIFGRITAEIGNMLPAGFVWRNGMHSMTRSVLLTIWVMSFTLIMLGINEAATHVVYINNEENRGKDLRIRVAVYGIITALGALIFVLTGSINAFSCAILVHFIYCILRIRKRWSHRAKVEFIHASVFVMITFAAALVYGSVRFTGLGLAVMLMILAEQYHYHIKMDLEEKEAALDKSTVKLLAEQISPHFIYNSLQSIEGLCDSDPVAAREAIDAFSVYLRGNLERLTEEDLIPFNSELEHVRAYLELEKIAGDRKFEVEYDLEVTDFMLPPLVLQPLVENAVRHAAKSGESVTQIRIATCRIDGNIRIEVTDRTEGAGDVPPVSAKNSQTGKKKSVGIENVRTRLDIQCGGSLTLKNIKEGTSAIIMLPKN